MTLLSIINRYLHSTIRNYLEQFVGKDLHHIRSLIYYTNTVTIVEKVVHTLPHYQKDPSSVSVCHTKTCIYKNTHRIDERLEHTDNSFLRDLKELEGKFVIVLLGSHNLR